MVSPDRTITRMPIVTVNSETNVAMDLLAIFDGKARVFRKISLGFMFKHMQVCTSCRAILCHKQSCQRLLTNITSSPICPRFTPESRCGITVTIGDERVVK